MRNFPTNKIYIFLIVLLTVLILVLVGIVASALIRPGKPAIKPDVISSTADPKAETIPPGQSTASLPTPKATSAITRPTTFYVSPEGNNSASGAFDQPWLTIQFAVSHVKPGDTVLVRGGEYGEGVRIGVSGTKDKPIRLKGFPGEAISIDGGEVPALFAEANYWIVESISFHSISDRAIRLNSSHWELTENKIYGAVYIWGNNNILRNNEVDGSRHVGNENGIMDDGPSSHNNQYIKNKVHDFNSRGIWSQWFTHDNLIENNLIYNIQGDPGICIDLDGASSVEYRHRITGNIVYNCSQTGIELENSYDTLVEKNLVYNTGLEGIQVISYLGCKAGGERNQYGDIDGECRGDELNSVLSQNIIHHAGRVGGIVSYESAGVKVYQNLVYGCESVALYLNSGLEHSHNWDVRGNIFSQNDRTEISVINPGSLINEEFNLIDHMDPDRVYEIRDSINQFYSLAAWQQLYKAGFSNISGNPFFVNSQMGDFHLLQNSPAIDHGFDSGTPLDFDNKPRIVGDRMDIGPFEYSPGN